MSQLHQFTKVEFSRFKALRSFRLSLRHFNVLVGPNNAGKSTILIAFRILAAALRSANAKKAHPVRGPVGSVLGYTVDLVATSVAEENIFYNYDVEVPAQIKFHLSNKNTLTLYFSEPGSCVLIADANGRSTTTPSAFRKQFNCPIGFVPILGPVEHNEPLYGPEAARRALFSYRAARNFRNIWHHYPDEFQNFRALLQETWPGMNIEPPEIDRNQGKPILYMYCPEDRIPREIFWSGFGFQVWCQMLTHLVQSKEKSMFLIDEPDIYLHSDLQRQLLGLLRNLGPDIVIATHSTEIITESEPDDILIINKDRTSSKRLSDQSQVGEVFRILGSGTNPILTQLAKTKRVVFVEGTDYQLLGKFASKLGKIGVSNRRDFAVISVGGFSPDRIRALKEGIEATLGVSVLTAAILDRDYRSSDECDAIRKKCTGFCDFTVIHERKEIENFLLNPHAIDRALSKKVSDKNKRTGSSTIFEGVAADLIDELSKEKKNYVNSP